MIEVIGPDKLDPHFAEFELTARRILPVMYYRPHQIDRFLHDQRPQPGQGFFSIRLNAGRSAFLKTRQSDSLNIAYLIPDNWYARYEIIRDAVSEVQERSRELRKEVFFRISEDLPSHNGYFGGLLATMGFDIRPRLELIAPDDALSRLRLPQLPSNVRERSLEDCALPVLNDVFNRAHSIYPSHKTEPDAVDRVMDREDTRKTFIALECDGDIVGFCYGILDHSINLDHWNDRLSIEELAVVPEYSGKRFGRYLAIRCMQELQRYFGRPGRGFFVGTDRTFARAWRLYESMGFSVAWVHSYAIYRPAAA